MCSSGGTVTRCCLAGAGRQPCAHDNRSPPLRGRLHADGQVFLLRRGPGGRAVVHRDPHRRPGETLRAGVTFRPKLDGPRSLTASRPAWGGWPTSGRPRVPATRMGFGLRWAGRGIGGLGGDSGGGPWRTERMHVTNATVAGVRTMLGDAFLGDPAGAGSWRRWAFAFQRIEIVNASGRRRRRTTWRAP